MKRVSRRADAVTAAVLLLLDAVLVVVLLLGVAVSGGLTGSPDRAAVAHEASRAALVCLGALLLSGPVVLAVRAWIALGVQAAVLGAAAAVFAGVGGG
ncbi:transporter [Streptomyces argenteolus]|uniref:transporter n=1 Tax=Streptomyces sp. NPDC025273 TaxID=3155251 RepID=UPI00337988D4